MPDFGYTTIGGSSDNSSNGSCLVCNLDAMPEDGALDSISFYTNYADTSDREIKGVLYEESGGPNALLAQSAAVFDAGATPGWITISASYSLLDTIVYWVGFMQEASASAYYYDSNASYDIPRDSNGTWPDPPDPHVGVNPQNRRMSSYITYTAAGGVTIPIMSHHYTKNIN